MLSIARAFAFLAVVAFGGSAVAQPGPGQNGGPVPPPSPWLYAAPQIYPPAGSCLTMPQTVTGGCEGSNTINAQGVFVSGNPVAAAGASAPLGGLPLYASPTGSGNCLSPGAGACSLATACSFVRQIATFIGSAGPINLADGTYSTAVSGALCSINGNGGGSSSQLVSIIGDVATPTNVVLAVPNNSIGVIAQDGGEVGINSLEFTGGNGSVGIQARQFAVADYSFVSWGSWGTGGSHFSVNQNASANLLNTETILANFTGSNHWTITGGGSFSAGAATNIPSAVSWSGGEFLGATGNVFIDLSGWSTTGSGVSGSTGVRATLQGPGYLVVAGSCASVLPGTALGGCSFSYGFQDSNGDGMTGTGIVVGQSQPTIDGQIVAPHTYAGLPGSPTAGQIEHIIDGLAANCGDGTCTAPNTTVTGGGGSLDLLIGWSGANWRMFRAAGTQSTTGTGALVLRVSPTLVGTPIISNNATTLGAPQSGTALLISSADAAITRIQLDSFANVGGVSCVRADGTNASPTALQNNDQICTYNAWGYDGTAISATSQASIEMYASQNWAVGAHGTYVQISTTPNGSVTRAARLNIENDGGIDCTGVTGGDQGAATLNCTKLYQAGVQVAAFNASTTVNGQNCALGGTCTVPTTSITVGTTTIGSGTPNGLLYDNAGVLGNLATANSGVLVTSSGGVPSISSTLPSGLSAPSFTVTTAFTATGLVTNADLANSTISGVALGGNLATLTYGTHLTNSAGASSYNGSAVSTLATDATNANTASTIVARDASGNFLAGTITASLTGHASLDCALTGCTYGGSVIFADGSTYSSTGLANLLSETIVAGTLGNGAMALNITATQPTSPVAAQQAILFTVTGAGSASQTNQAFSVNYAAGYTGISPTSAGNFINSNAGTAGAITASNITGNSGNATNANATTAGYNVGMFGRASNGNANFGLVGLSGVNKNSAVNIGVMGLGLNAGTSPVEVGGWFTLGQTTLPSVSAALIADNAGQTTVPIAIFQNGGLQVASIGPTGHILASGTAPTISACGTGTPTISGGDNFGKVVAGTVATSCVINFGTTWGTAPSCNAASGTAIASLTVSATTTQLTITGTALGGDTITWICGSTASLEPRDLPTNDNAPPWLSKAA